MDLLVLPAQRHELVVGAALQDAALVQDDDLVGVLHGAQPLGDDDLGGAGDLPGEGPADEGVGAGVDGGGRVVEDEDLRPLEQGAGDAQALLLASGHIGAALLDAGVVAVGELPDELVGLGELAGADELGVGGVGVAPAQVLLDGAGEQDVLLQDDGDLVAQPGQVVVAHVDAADHHAPGGHVVQARDELDERRLPRAGAAHDAQGRARGDRQVDPAQGVGLGLPGVAEGDALEADLAVGHLGQPVGGGGQDGTVDDDLGDAVGGLRRHGDHDEDEGEHHHRGEDLHAVGHQRGELSSRQLRGAAVHDHPGAQVVDEHERRVDEEDHDRTVEREDLLGAGEVPAHLLGGGPELRLLMVLRDEGLHDPDRGEVLLHGIVQGVVLLEYPAEDREHVGDQADERAAEQRQHDDEDERQPRVDHQGHDDREDDHEGHAHGDADDYLVRVLNVRDVGGHAGDQRGRREAVDVREGELLDPEEQVLAQVAGQAGGGGGGAHAGHDAARQRDHRHDDQGQADPQDRAHGPAREGVDELGHHEGQDALEPGLAHHEQRRLQRRPPVLAQAAHEYAYGFHRRLPPIPS